MKKEDLTGAASGYQAHRRDQARMGLRLTPAERLRWLEETMETLRRWRGRAQSARRERDGLEEE
jgi:hypothetical protein